MLAWLAPALADLLYPQLDPVLIAAFATVHDAVEVYAGEFTAILDLRSEISRRLADLLREREPGSTA
jgi:hypothetical protein